MKAAYSKGSSPTVSPAGEFHQRPFPGGGTRLAVGEQREPEGGNYPNLLSVRYVTDREVKECGGTVFGTSSVRLVTIDGFRFEVRPEGDLLIYFNVDRPGCSPVGSVLANSMSTLPASRSAAPRPS